MVVQSTTGVACLPLCWTLLYLFLPAIPLLWEPGVWVRFSQVRKQTFSSLVGVGNKWLVEGSIKGQKGKKRINAMKQVTEKTESSDGDQDKSCGKVNTIHIRSVKGCAARLEAEINDVRVKMLYDPGAAQSVTSEQTWRKGGAPPLKPTVTLVTYANVPVETLGETEVRVRAFGRVKCLLVSVVKEQD